MLSSLRPDQIKKKNQVKAGFDLFDLAFRPGFLGASIFSAMALSLWVLVLNGQLSLPSQGLSILVWHFHEMVFGFAAFVALSFLLTASQTWTKLRSLNGKLLMFWCAVWLSVRILLWQDNVSLQYLAYGLQLLWWLIGIGFLAQLLYRANNRNLMLLPLLSIMMLMNMAIIIADLKGDTNLALHFGRTAVLLFALLAGILGGRLIPMFTRNGTRLLAQPAKVIETPKLTKLLIITALINNIYAFLYPFFEFALVPGVIMICLGVLQLIQLYHWDPKASLKVPLLWSLHLTYALLGIGFICLGASYFTDLIRFADALHVIGIGAIGGMILAIMSRVSLGHTGRLIQSSPLMSVAFILMFLAALTRVLLPSLGLTMLGWQLSAALWIAAFLLFIFHYSNILIRQRL
jgi:uncharacterized protein involved in response to NO